MDGWGASTGYFAANVNLGASQADLFFSKTDGIGLEYVRTTNTPDGSKPDLPTLQLAVGRGAKVLLSFYSAPASMMSNGEFAVMGGYVLPMSYGAFASYAVDWIQTLESKGVHVDYFSPTNEPNINEVWTASTLDTFVSHNLGPAFASAGLTTSIVIPETSGWFSPDDITTCMGDPDCAKYVTIAASHGYGGGSVDGTGVSYCCSTAAAAPTSIGSRRVWMTEINGGFTKETSNDTNMWVYDASIADAMVWAHNIHDYMTVANASAWMYWNLASYSPIEYNDGLTDYSFNPAKRFYVVGNFSRYVRSGWLRIDATESPASGLYVTAFRDPSSDAFVVVAVNENVSSSPLTVSLVGFPSVDRVTPTVTSEGDALADQTDVTVAAGAFTYTLPPTSVVSFHRDPPVAPPDDGGAPDAGCPRDSGDSEAREGGSPPPRESGASNSDGAASSPATGPPSSGCGCVEAGASTGEGHAAGALLLAGFALGLRRRRVL
jgi:glucuronoarabinoxylan endo-1,4-beta-xylanase